MSGFSDAVPMLILMTGYLFVPVTIALGSWWYEARRAQRREEKKS